MHCKFIVSFLQLYADWYCVFSFSTESNVATGNTKTNNKVESKTTRIEDPIKTPSEPDNEGDVDDDDDDSAEADTVVKEEATDLTKEELALRIYNTITSTILPQLHKCVTKKASL